jgi:hypothetical protein
MKDPDWRSAYDDVACDNHHLEQILAEHRLALEALLRATEANQPQKTNLLGRYFRVQAIRHARRLLKGRRGVCNDWVEDV